MIHTIRKASENSEAFLLFTAQNFLKHQIKQWLAPRYDSLDETFRNDCNELWQTIHKFEGIWDHVINLCRAIMEFGNLVEIHYD